MKEKLDKLGVECTILLRRDHRGGTQVDKFVAFFLKEFGIQPKHKKKNKAKAKAKKRTVR